MQKSKGLITHAVHKGGTAKPWGKSLQWTVLGQLDIYKENNKTWPQLHTSNQFQVDCTQNNKAYGKTPSWSEGREIFT